MNGLKVFCSRGLRRIFGPKVKTVTGDWSKLHYEELHDLYSVPNIVRVIISMRIRWTEHVARMGKKINSCTILVGKREGKRTVGVGWKIILK